MNRTTLTLLLGSLLALVPGLVQAQSIDYASLEELFGEPVTASATGKPQRTSEAPVPMEIVTAEDIRRTGATNIPDALRHVTGIDVIRWSTEGADVSVRGFNSPYNPRLLVLVNGRQVYADHFGMVFWNAIPVQMSEIRQIEVVKGANTALFGFNAAIGVINIVTYNPLFDEVNDVRAIYGTQNTREVTGVLSKRFGDAGGLSFSGSFLDAEPFDGGGPQRMIPAVEPETRAANLRGQFRTGAKSEVGFEASYSSSKRAAFVPMFIPSTPDVEIASFHGTFMKDSDLGLVKFNAYYNSLDHSTDVMGFGQLNYENDIFVAQVEDLFKIGSRHSLRLSGEYRNNVYRGDFAANPFDEGTEATFNAFGVSGMWDWRATENLSFVGSLRLDVVDTRREGFTVPGVPITNDDFDKTITEYTYNTGLVWRADSKTRIRASAARGAKLMSLLEFATVGIGPGPMPGSTFIMMGDPDLGASIAESYNVGLSRDMPGIASTLEIDGFYSSLSKNVTVANFMPTFVAMPFMVAQPVDVGSSDQFGLEVEVTGEKHGVRWGVSYALLDVDDDFDLFADGNSFVGTDFERSTPKHHAILSGGFTVKSFEIDLYGNYYSSTQRVQMTGPTTGFALTDVSDIFTLSGRAAYRISEYFDVAVSAVALNHDYYRASQADLVERQLYVTAGFHW